MTDYNDKIESGELTPSEAIYLRDKHPITPLGLPKEFNIDALQPKQAEVLNRGDVRFSQDPVDSVTMMILQSLSSDGSLFFIANKAAEMVIGNGVYPELEPLNHDKDETLTIEGDEEKKAIAYLKERDAHVGKSESGVSFHLSFDQVVDAVCKLLMVYHRVAVKKHYGASGAISPDGSPNGDWPDVLEVIHPRDLGIIGLDKYGSVNSIYRNQPFFERLDSKQLIYAYNGFEGVQIHNAQGFGAPAGLGLVSSQRLLNKIENEDLPALLRVCWTGIPLIVYHTPGATAEKRREYIQSISDQLTAGGPMIISADPEQFAVHNLNINAKIKEILDLWVALHKKAAAEYGIPSTFISDDAEANRSTLPQKMHISLETGLRPRQRRLARVFEEQWYAPEFERVFPHLAKKYRVRMMFKSLNMESLAERVEAIVNASNIYRLTPSAFGKYIGLEHYGQDVDKEWIELQKKQLTQPTPNGSKVNVHQTDKGGKQVGKKYPSDK